MSLVCEGCQDGGRLGTDTVNMIERGEIRVGERERGRKRGREKKREGEREIRRD